MHEIFKCARKETNELSWTSCKRGKRCQRGKERKTLSCWNQQSATKSFNHLYVYWKMCLLYRFTTLLTPFINKLLGCRYKPKHNLCKWQTQSTSMSTQTGELVKPINLSQKEWSNNHPKDDLLLKLVKCIAIILNRVSLLCWRLLAISNLY